IRARVATLIAVAVCSATACSLLVDTSGLAGAAADASALSDIEAGLPEAPTASWCARQSGLAFCDDFDTSPDAGLTSKWDSVEFKAGFLGIDGTASSSPPSSLLASVPAS